MPVRIQYLSAQLLVELLQTQLFAMIHIRIKVRGAKGQAVFDEVLE